MSSVPVWCALHHKNVYAWTAEPFASGDELTIVERAWFGSREPVARYIRRIGIVQQCAPMEQRELDSLIAESNTKLDAYFKEQEQFLQKLFIASNAQAEIFVKSDGPLAVYAEKMRAAEHVIDDIHKQWSASNRQPFPSLDYLASKKYFEVKP